MFVSKGAYIRGGLIFGILRFGAIQKLRNVQRGRGSTNVLHIVTYILRGRGVIYDIVT